MQIVLDTKKITDYRQFLAVKRLPVYSITGHVASFPDEYASLLNLAQPQIAASGYIPHPDQYDYQRDISALAIDKKKFSVFARPGLGKTFIMNEFSRHAATHLQKGKCVLIVAPPMVVSQHITEYQRFYNESPESDLNYRQVLAAELQDWLISGTERIGITNYEALKDGVKPGRLGSLLLDESSMLKSHYGKWGQRCIELGKGLEYKLALTGTPAPNDQIEYGNHTVFMDQFPNTNAFLAKYFVNKGQTQQRWELKQHAVDAFYRSLSHWCIFLTNPGTYGWKDNCGTIPPIETHIEHVGLTPEQEELVRGRVGGLFAYKIGGVVSRAALGQIAKGFYKDVEIPTLKPDWIADKIKTWPDESTIVWCIYNGEQERMAAMLPGCANIDGKTPLWKRIELINEFKSGQRKVLVSKAKILGFGLNLQVATRHVFSGLQDSYEMYFQCIARSNRIGSTKTLHVHIPVTDVEMPMVETVLRKAKRVQQDEENQERIFRNASAN